MGPFKEQGLNGQIKISGTKIIEASISAVIGAVVSGALLMIVAQKVLVEKVDNLHTSVSELKETTKETLKDHEVRLRDVEITLASARNGRRY